MSAEAIYVGIDVSQERLDVAVRPAGDSWGVGYDQPGLEQLAAELAELGPAAVVLEATGNLEVPAVRWPSAGSAGGGGQSRQVRDFAKATGRLAKTDALDAQVLAHFAEAVRPAQRPLPDAQTQELAALTTRRNQVITMLVCREEPPGPGHCWGTSQHSGPHRLAGGGNWTTWTGDQTEHQAKSIVA